MTSAQSHHNLCSEFLCAAMNASKYVEDEPSFFERERNRLCSEISRDFEELLSSTNMLSRKLEDALGMRKELEPITNLWESFYELMKEQQPDVEFGTDGQGIPGTGGHVVTGKVSE